MNDSPRRLYDRVGPRIRQVSKHIMKATDTKRAKKGRSKKALMAQPKRTMKKDRFANLEPKLAELARKQWPEKGRAERIARAEQAWKEIREIASTFKKLDPETLKWIAEDPELEYT